MYCRRSLCSFEALGSVPERIIFSSVFGVVLPAVLAQDLRIRTLFFLRWFQYLERAQQALVYAHHSASIVEFTTVVRGGEQGNQLPLRKELVSVLDDLMSPANEIHIMFLQEPRNHIRAEGEGYATIVFAPAGDILVWIGPEQVAEQTTIGNISWTHDPPDLFHGVQIWGETTMHGENFLIDDRSDWEAVEAVSKSLPELDVVSSLALIVEAIDTVYRCTLVVASKDKEILWILDLVGEEEADGLQGLLSSVDVVAQKEVVGFRRESSILKQTQEIVVLAVNITTDLYGSLELEQDWLGDENFPSFRT